MKGKIKNKRYTEEEKENLRKLGELLVKMHKRQMKEQKKGNKELETMSKKDTLSLAYCPQD